jgi:hypothetical protein
MKFGIEIGSNGMIHTYMPCYIKICSGIRKLTGRIHRHTGKRSHKRTLEVKNYYMVTTVKFLENDISVCVSFRWVSR